MHTAAYALASTLGLAAWLIIPSALAGLAYHWHELRAEDRRIVAESRARRTKALAGDRHAA